MRRVALAGPSATSLRGSVYDWPRPGHGQWQLDALGAARCGPRVALVIGVRSNAYPLRVAGPVLRARSTPRMGIGSRPNMADPLRQVAFEAAGVIMQAG